MIDIEKLPWPEGCERFFVDHGIKYFCVACEGVIPCIDLLACVDDFIPRQDMCNAARCWFLDQAEKSYQVLMHPKTKQPEEKLHDRLYSQHSSAAKAWGKAGGGDQK